MKTTRILLAFMAIAFAGCATVHDAKTAKGIGEFQCFNYPLETVWPEVIDAIKFTDGRIVEINKTERYILASYGPHSLPVGAGSYGDKLAIFFESVDGNTVIEIVDKRALSYNFPFKDWLPKQLFQNIDTQLRFAKISREPVKKEKVVREENDNK